MVYTKRGVAYLRDEPVFETIEKSLKTWLNHPIFQQPQKFLVPQLWSGAVVIMDNLPAHKLASIEPMIESVGAKVICLSPYSPDFNPIELWWSQLKSFLRTFSPTTTEMVDKVISVALDLMNPQHLKNWFTKLLLLYLMTTGSAVNAIAKQSLRAIAKHYLHEIAKELVVGNRRLG
jgi:transposase